MPEVPSLGPRGEGWVVLQFALMGAIVIVAVLGPGWPGSVGSARLAAGTILAISGAAVVVGSARALGRGLTPFPSPAPSGRLVVRGPYRYVRHPIYTGGLLFFIGVALATSPAALLPIALLLVVWALKLSVEERFLRAAYPAYAGYCATTRRRLIPFVY